MSTLGDDYPVQQARVRELIATYRTLGPSCAFAIAMCEATLRQADEAAMSGDLARMIQAYQEMKECE